MSSGLKFTISGYASSSNVDEVSQGQQFRCSNSFFGFLDASGFKKSACSAGEHRRCLSGTPEWGRFPGEGNGSPLQYSCLGNPVDREVWWATFRGVTKVWRDWVTKHSHTLLSICILFYIYALSSYFKMSYFSPGGNLSNSFLYISKSCRAIL